MGYTKFILLYLLKHVGSCGDIEYRNILVRKRIGKLKRFVKIEEARDGE